MVGGGWREGEGKGKKTNAEEVAEETVGEVHFEEVDVCVLVVNLDRFGVREVVDNRPHHCSPRQLDELPINTQVTFSQENLPL